MIAHDEHEHMANAADNGARKIINKIKKRALKGTESPNVIVGEVITKASTSVAVELPTASTIKKNIQRLRRQHNPQLLTPNSLSELELPESYQLTLKGDNFLLHDSCNRKTRMLVFGTMENLRRLGSCRIWMADGTFSSVPSIFTQLYTIHGCLHKKDDETGHIEIKSIPLVYVLTPSKKEATYERLLNCLIDISDVHLEPEVFISDFEESFINAIKKVFPNVSHHGCYFHFSQCVIRHVAALGLKQRYNTDDEFALNVKMLIALAFVHPDFVIRGFESVKSSDYYRDPANNLSDLVKYFKKTWIGVVRSNGQSSAKFPIPLWNCYHTVINNDPQTNNAMEGWHNSFHQRVGKSHEQLGKFIHALQVEQASAEITWEQFNAGRTVTTRKRRKYIDYDARILAMVMDWSEESDMMEYVRGLAHSVSP